MEVHLYIIADVLKLLIWCLHPYSFYCRICNNLHISVLKTNQPTDKHSEVEKLLARAKNHLLLLLTPLTTKSFSDLRWLLSLKLDEMRSHVFLPMILVSLFKQKLDISNSHWRKIPHQAILITFSINISFYKTVYTDLLSKGT